MPGCVLIRALEPMAGIELMQRPASRRAQAGRLASGPGETHPRNGYHPGAQWRGRHAWHAGSQGRRYSRTGGDRGDPAGGHSLLRRLALRFIIRGNRFVGRP